MRRITALLGGAAVVVTAGLSAAAPATAATSHPAAAAAHSLGGEMAIPVHPVTYTAPVQPGAAQIPLVGSYKLCLRGDHLECLTGEGQGPNMKIFQTGYTTFTLVENMSGVIWLNQSDNCVHGTSSANVTIAQNSDCQNNNTASVWLLEGSDDLLQNQAYGGEIATTGDRSGDNVYLEPSGTSGAWFAIGIQNT